VIARTTTDVIANAADSAKATCLDDSQLCGTHSRILSTFVRFTLSARTLGPARVFSKVISRTRARLRRSPKAFAQPSNLEALHHCSWLGTIPGLGVVDSVVNQRDLLQFQTRMNYPYFYYLAERRIRYSLWHYVGTELCGLDRSSVVIDAGAQAGLWGLMVRRDYGCRVFDLDLEYRPGRHGFRIGAPASAIPLESSSVSHIVSFCAFNCFEGNDDSSMIREAARVLVPGGRLIIVPLCVGDDYVNLYDPRLLAGVERLDEGARPAAMTDWGNRFGRWYDREAFTSRILRHAGAFDLEIHRVRHPFNPHEGFEAMFAARFIRRH
jgi:SAM-dependent methyltransferase